MLKSELLLRNLDLMTSPTPPKSRLPRLGPQSNRLETLPITMPLEWTLKRQEKKVSNYDVIRGLTEVLISKRHSKTSAVKKRTKLNS